MRLIRRITLAVGSPFTLGMTLWILMVAQRTPWKTALWATWAGLVFGSMLAATTYSFLRWIKGHWPGILGLLLAQLLAASVASAALLYLTARWPAPGHWKELPAFPEVPTRIEGATCVYDSRFDLAVRGATGRVFHLFRNDSSKSRWVLESEASVRGNEPVCECERGTSTEPLHDYPGLPRSPLQVHRVQLRGADCGGEAAYLIAGDGTLWRWEVYSCALGVLPLGIGILGLAFILAIAAFAVTLSSPEGWAWRLKPELQASAPRPASGPLDW